MFTSFKSPKDFYSLTIKQLEYLLEEQRRQRSDLAELLSLAHRKLGYYKEDNTTLDEYETPPQTDSNDKSDLDWLLSPELKSRLELHLDSTENIVTWILQTNSFKNLFHRVIEIELLESRDT